MRQLFLLLPFALSLRHFQYPRGAGPIVRPGQADGEDTAKFKSTPYKIGGIGRLSQQLLGRVLSATHSLRASLHPEITDIIVTDANPTKQVADIEDLISKIQPDPVLASDDKAIEPC